MCRQRLIWARCGHGDFQPIEKCTKAFETGRCWTYVYGDYIVDPSPETIVKWDCQWCIHVKPGLEQRRTMSQYPTPQSSTNSSQSNSVVPQTSHHTRSQGLLQRDFHDDMANNFAYNIQNYAQLVPTKHVLDPRLDLDPAKPEPAFPPELEELFKGSFGSA